MPTNTLTVEATSDAAQAAEVARSPRMSTGRILLLVFGSIATLLAIALLAGGGEPACPGIGIPDQAAPPSQRASP